MTRFTSRLLTTAALTFSASLLAACGGGGSSSAPVGVAPTPGGSSEPTWTAGTYAPASSFKNQCASPRTTNDIDGNPYPDMAGSTTREKFWLRSWTDETYLWYDEVPDINPGNSDDRLTYFDKLRTSATTASGTNKDQFHFTIPTDEYEQRVATGASAGYGADFVLIESSPPRDIRVALVQPDSPAAANNNLLRGTEILEIDGEDAVNGSNTNVLNAGLFPSAAGETHTFLVRDVGTQATRTVTLTSDVVAEQPVNTTKVIDTPTGKVGYILFTTFGVSTAEQQIANAYTNMKNAGINDLVLDLRYNGGGFLAIASQIAYMTAGDARTANANFETLQFNDKHPTVNPVTGRTITPTPFYKESLGFNDAFPEGRDLDTVDLPRIFILSTDNTCSASEAVINGLRGIDVEVILIGSKTCGKPYGFYGTDNCGETYFTIQFRGVNNKNFGDYADGFAPNNASSAVGEKITGCVASDDYSSQLGDETENMLSTALSFRANGTCPASSAATAQAKTQPRFESDPAASLLNDERVRSRLALENNRILDTPRNQ
ncbi:S41 family peptidase [Hellea balneolensis]|uniref:S41 family peptidase n=1 Tax=Hellea balneolensis TaxID=287478 RepID=UPI000425A44A|nr:S41 family peptidase [Hellea balneolensis]